MPFKNLVLAIAAVAVITPVFAQIADFPADTVAGIPANYTEALVGSYSLPEILVDRQGKPVTSAAAWFDHRRAEIVSLFEEYQFGKSPAAPAHIRYEVHENGAPAFDDLGKRTQLTLFFAEAADEPKMDVVFYVPAGAEGPVPLLLYIGFTPNSLVTGDPGVKKGYYWNREHEKVPVGDRKRFDKLEVPAFLARGFGVATVYYGDIEPDFQGGARHGIRNLFPATGKPDEWGSFAAWSYGLSRILDYFEEEPAVDAGRVAIAGISRLGKTVLWAGALDTRFAMVIPMCSGESGAALSRRNYGETIAHITEKTRFPYWFAPKYQEYGSDVSALPVDAHMLLSLIAPRPLLLTTGNTDKWSDPYGEFLAAVAAGPVYQMLGKEGLDTDKMPPAGEAILKDIGYFMHDGGHGTVPQDWEIVLDFMAQHFL